MSPEYILHRDTYLDSVTKAISGVLAPLVSADERAQRKAMLKFHKQITLVASELASMMRTSPERYSFSDPNMGPRLFLNDDLKDCNMVDVVSQRRIKALKLVHIDENGKIGEILNVLHPALYGTAVRIRKIL